MNPKSAGQVQARKSALAKGDSRFWLEPGKLLRKTGRSVYEFQFQIAGRRFTFSTRTGNREAGAKIAARIYSDFAELGVAEALKIHRAGNAPERVATVGEWIEAAREVSDAGLVTFGCYAASLRKIAGDIIGVERSRKRFGPKKGGAQAYRAKIDGTSLDVLSLPALQQWKLAYVKRAKTPAAERSRMTSANSTIRQAKSLFAEKITRFVTLRLPDPKPFDGLEFYPRQSSKYLSRIDAGALVRAAHDELAESNRMRPRSWPSFWQSRVA